MKQHSLGLATTSKRTRGGREFVEKLERAVPWAGLVRLMSPYLSEGRRGRSQFAPESVLRIHLMQQWFTLSVSGMGEALQDVPLFREFADLEGWDERFPDESIILGFSHVL